MNLPVIDCNGCGACCTQLVWPPFYGCDDPSYQALERERPDLAAQLAADRDRRRAEGSPDWGSPCSWFDAETRRCKHYDHRPEICRDFEVGEGDCLAWRKDAGVA